MTIRKTLQLLTLASTVLLVGACSTTTPHGHLKDDALLADIHTGTTTRDDVLRVLGTPSSQSTFGPSTWYYISSTKRTRSLLAPEIVDQDVIEIAFDSSGLVTSVKHYSLADGKNVQIAQKVTPSEGQTLGFFEQIMANLGRFNKSGSSPITPNTHNQSPPIGGLPPVAR